MDIGLNIEKKVGPRCWAMIVPPKMLQATLHPTHRPCTLQGLEAHTSKTVREELCLSRSRKPWPLVASGKAHVEIEIFEKLEIIGMIVNMYSLGSYFLSMFRH